jgi:hypothetical protein
MLWVPEGMSTTEITARLGCHLAAVQKHVVVLKRLLPLTSTLKRRPQVDQHHHEGESEEAHDAGPFQKCQAAEKGRV